MHEKPNPHAQGERCEARTRTGRPCKNAAMLNGRCRMHGGKSLKGVASPKFQSGKYSKDLIANLQSTYREAVNDPRLLKLIDEIALTDALIKDLLKNGGSVAAWQRLLKTSAEIEAAICANDAEATDAALKKHKNVIDEGERDAAHRDEIMLRFEQRRRLVESERRHRADKRYVITYEQLAVEVAALVDILSRHIKDRETFIAINREIHRSC